MNRSLSPLTYWGTTDIIHRKSDRGNMPRRTAEIRRHVYMSKTARSHFMASFQMRAMELSESALASGEGGVAIATSRSGMAAMIAQNIAQQKGMS